ncbi:MAG TPA: hypothetical protein DCM87_11805 [Planctomycetes bacterium]|jgi:hypothetical protein|nr:hypothetical protein [Planctomycetota bacterium]
MSTNHHGSKGPEKQEHKKSGGMRLALPMFIAAAALVLCWFYMSALAPLQIDPRHSQDCFLYKSIAWIVSSPVNKALFGCMLAAVFLLGFKLKDWAIGYYRFVTISVLLSVAVVAWDLSSPAGHVTKFINKLLDVNFFA